MFYGYKFFKFIIFFNFNMDVGLCEIFILVCLIFFIIGIGFYFNLVLFLWNSKVSFILFKFIV